MLNYKQIHQKVFKDIHTAISTKRPNITAGPFFETQQLSIPVEILQKPFPKYTKSHIRDD